ncbi:MAG: hypothetical protein RL662_160, partial [Bacteroidota bacterium]
SIIGCLLMLLATSKILKNDSAIRLIKLEQNVKLNFVDHLISQDDFLF